MRSHGGLVETWKFFPGFFILNKKKMPKQSSKKRIYKDEWEAIPEFKDWIRKSYTDSDRVHCKFCNTEFRAHKSDITNHRNTAKHKRIETARAQQAFAPALPKEVSISAEQRRKRFELRLALYIAVKCSFKWVFLLRNFLTHRN